MLGGVVAVVAVAQRLQLVVLVVALVVGLAGAQELQLGYGTKFGTQPGKAVPGRTLGLGAGAGPVGGEEGALLQVLHRLELYRSLTGGEPSLGYLDNTCPEGCPTGAHCSYGLCFCDSELAQHLDEMEAGSNVSAEAYDASYVEQEDWHGSLMGNCSSPELGVNETAPALGSPCSSPADCWSVDVNSVCSPAFTCICKAGTVFNKRLGQCEMSLTVDCSSLSPDSPASPALATLAEEILAGNTSGSPEPSEYSESLLAYMEPAVSGRNYSEELVLEAFCRDVDFFALQLASGEVSSHDMIEMLEEAMEEVLNTSTKILGMVVAIFLLLLVLLCLLGCVCYCSSDSCRIKINALFAPTNYSEGLDNKAATPLTKDAEAGGQDELERVVSGYQPVPQQPPPSYPQGANSLPRGAASSKNSSLPRGAGSKNSSLPRGASLPRNSASLARGVSPIPRAYPALAEAPPGYPESPQKAGVPPIGFPQSPPEYPQTPTPPGFPADQNKQVATLNLEK